MKTRGFRFIGSVVGLLVACAAFFVPLSSCRQEIENLGIKLSVEQETLSNGLRVILAEDHTVPIVSYQTWYRVGSVDERPGVTGISHLFEHMMFKGTLKYPAKKFFQELEAKGAEVNAYTTRDYTVYYENFIPNLLEKVIDMESDRMSNLILTEEVLETERQVVLEERELRTDNSISGRIQEAIWQQAFRYHPYGWPVIGYPQDVANVPLADVIKYYKEHYNPSTATVVVSGDFDPRQTLKLIRKYYGEIASAKPPERAFRDEPAQDEERRLVLRDKVVAENFAHAYHITAAKDDDSYAMDVLSNILFEGTHSRAYRRLVEEKDLLASVSGTSFTPTYPGLLMVSGVMKGKLKATDAEPAIDQLISEIQKDGVTQDEINTAIKQLTVQLVDNIRTPYGLGQLLGAVQVILGDAQKFSRDLEKYLRVTADDVKRVANKYLIPNNRSVVILVPEEPAKTPGKGGSL